MTKDAKPRVLRCANCREEIEGRPQNEHFPFCSKRCRQVDLGRWLNEEYRVTVDRDSTERALPPTPPTEGDE